VANEDEATTCGDWEISSIPQCTKLPYSEMIRQGTSEVATIIEWNHRGTQCSFLFKGSIG